jgi:hypothetical protein
MGHWIDSVKGRTLNMHLGSAAHYAELILRTPPKLFAELVDPSP